MALLKCPDCGSEISDQAPACLKCGRPTRAVREKKDPTLLLMMGVLLVGMGGCSALTSLSDTGDRQLGGFAIAIVLVALGVPLLVRARRAGR